MKLPIVKYEARIAQNRDDIGGPWVNAEVADGETVVYDTPEEAMTGAIDAMCADGNDDPDYIKDCLYVAKIVIEEIYQPTKAVLNAYQKVVDQDSFSQSDVVAAVKKAMKR